jgi:hypothetical protein
MKKEYLGDGVYAEWDTDGYLVLTTENGIAATNTIFLEPRVLQALLDNIKRENAEGTTP